MIEGEDSQHRGNDTRDDCGDYWTISLEWIVDVVAPLKGHCVLDTVFEAVSMLTNTFRRAFISAFYANVLWKGDLAEALISITPQPPLFPGTCVSRDHRSRKTVQQEDRVREGFSNLGIASVFTLVNDHFILHFTLAMTNVQISLSRLARVLHPFTGTGGRVFSGIAIINA